VVEEVQMGQKFPPLLRYSLSISFYRSSIILLSLSNMNVIYSHKLTASLNTKVTRMSWAAALTFSRKYYLLNSEDETTLMTSWRLCAHYFPLNSNKDTASLFQRGYAKILRETKNANIKTKQNLHSFPKHVVTAATKTLVSRSDRTKNLCTSSVQGSTNNQNKGVNNEI